MILSRVYVASSWRNERQQAVVELLRSEGFGVYDFRHPVESGPGAHGFSWSEIDPNWKDWTPQQFQKALDHPVAVRGFSLDMSALALCDACVLVMPCGRSAHLEFGYAVGARKLTIILQEQAAEPELMYSMASRVVTRLSDVAAALLGAL